MAAKVKIGVLGASGYTGSELVRLLLRHPRVEIALLTADRRAGQEMRQVFPQFAPFKLPKLVAIDGVDWKSAGLDLIFCALPHATTQVVIKDLFAKAPGTKVVDLSADFRLADPAAYAKWYGHEHHAPELQRQARRLPQERMLWLREADPRGTPGSRCRGRCTRRHRPLVGGCCLPGTDELRGLEPCEFSLIRPQRSQKRRTSDHPGRLPRCRQ